MAETIEGLRKKMEILEYPQETIERALNIAKVSFEAMDYVKNHLEVDDVQAEKILHAYLDKKYNSDEFDLNDVEGAFKIVFEHTANFVIKCGFPAERKEEFISSALELVTITGEMEKLKQLKSKFL